MNTEEQVVEDKACDTLLHSEIDHDSCLIEENNILTESLSGLLHDDNDDSGFDLKTDFDTLQSMQAQPVEQGYYLNNDYVMYSYPHPDATYTNDQVYQGIDGAPTVTPDPSTHSLTYRYHPYIQYNDTTGSGNRRNFQGRKETIDERFKQLPKQFQSIRGRKSGSVTRRVKNFEQRSEATKRESARMCVIRAEFQRLLDLLPVRRHPSTCKPLCRVLILQESVMYIKALTQVLVNSGIQVPTDDQWRIHTKPINTSSQSSASATQHSATQHYSTQHNATLHNATQQDVAQGMTVESQAWFDTLTPPTTPALDQFNSC